MWKQSSTNIHDKLVSTLSKLTNILLVLHNSQIALKSSMLDNEGFRSAQLIRVSHRYEQITRRTNYLYWKVPLISTINYLSKLTNNLLVLQNSQNFQIALKSSMLDNKAFRFCSSSGYHVDMNKLQEESTYYAES